MFILPMCGTAAQDDPEIMISSASIVLEVGVMNAPMKHILNYVLFFSFFKNTSKCLFVFFRFVVDLHINNFTDVGFCVYVIFHF